MGGVAPPPPLEGQNFAAVRQKIKNLLKHNFLSWGSLVPVSFQDLAQFSRKVSKYPQLLMLNLCHNRKLEKIKKNTVYDCEALVKCLHFLSNTRVVHKVTLFWASFRPQTPLKKPLFQWYWCGLCRWPQVLPRPQLIFSFQNLVFFGIYLNFQRQKPLKNQHLPHSQSKSYQINSIKSCSSRSFQKHKKARSNSSEFFSATI